IGSVPGGDDPVAGDHSPAALLDRDEPAAVGLQIRYLDLDDAHAAARGAVDDGGLRLVGRLSGGVNPTAPGNPPDGAEGNGESERMLNRGSCLCHRLAPFQSN